MEWSLNWEEEGLIGLIWLKPNFKNYCGKGFLRRRKRGIIG